MRDYQPGDEDGVLRLVTDVLALYDLEIDPMGIDRDLADIQASYIERGGLFKVIVSEGKIVGSYGLYPEGEGLFELRKMYLLPAFQGQGLGHCMLQDALMLARERGAQAIVLESNSKLTRAAHLYKTYGFVRASSRSLSNRCDYAMRLELSG
jgi:putative acetyltransferase